MNSDQNKKTLISLFLTLIAALVLFYFLLPAINIKSTGFYMYLIMVVASFILIHLLLSGSGSNLKFKREMMEDGTFKIVLDTNGSSKQKQEGRQNFSQNPFETYDQKTSGGNFEDFDKTLKKSKSKAFSYPVMLIILLLGIVFIGGFLSGPLIFTDEYTRLIHIETGNFEEEVAEISYDQIPWLDKASAQRLGDRKLGELADMVSQFEVASDYTQINYKSRPVRVTPLLYGDVFKWFNNRENGIPGYIQIDMVTQEGDVVRLSDGIKYSRSEYFGRYIDRYIRFNYPTFMFDTPIFEVDDNGDPYWICPKVVKTIGLFGGTDVDGVVVVNAVTGEHTYYAPNEVPQWIDHVYPAELIIEQYDYYGSYQGGFINSIFGQRGVTMTTDGYNYLALNDDVYVYTGITSVGNDESNIGFILVNQRTKDSRYYSIPGAHEYSAMSSAEGALQHLNYEATFPLLLNIAGEPTYFMAMKDYSNLVKQYAMVNVKSYNIVSTGMTVAECEENYIQLLSRHSGSTIVSTQGINVTGVISDIRVSVIDGDSHYYIRLEGSPKYYVISASGDNRAVLLNVGDRVILIAAETNKMIEPIRSFEWVTAPPATDNSSVSTTVST
ncbi:hypothetical protein [Methanolapillus ohkumae]|uniref:CvpA family protein n=1 Tax=Methanolapillus ohkumae TaxID=3028298 RepID=A0AA96V7C2_9EURY|nr:hypothetical protein MsAm2_09670 [Methanosarcinaceae archaeon Am2]